MDSVQTRVEEKEEGKLQDPPQPRRRYRILYPLLILFTLMGLAPLLTAAWKLISISREALITAQQANQLQVASSIAGLMDARIEFLQGQLRQMEKGVESILETNGPRGLRNYLREGGGVDRFLAGEYLRVELVLKSGTRYHAENGSLAKSAEATSLLKKARSRLRSGGSLITLGPRLVEGRKTSASLLVLATSLERNGKTIGSLSALVDVQGIWEQAIGSLLTGYTLYALDPEGNLFAQRDPTGLLAAADYHKFELVEKFLSVGSRSKETSDFRIRIGGEDKEILGSFDETSLGWGIFAQVEKKLAYSSVQGMVRSTMTWAIGAFGMALLMGGVFATSLSRPIQRLAASSRAFAKGDFSVRVRINSRHEIGELAETFNFMSEAIQGYIQKLRNAARENSELFLGIIRALAEAIDEKDPYTRGHSERVNQYSVILAKQMRLSKKELRNIHVASLLHDIGKIGIDDQILRKPGVLTDEEYQLMKHHPDKGANMLAPIKNMKDIIPGLLHHHERWKGGGYPQGLKGKEIPLAARIITVADTFDAMTTNRPYQKAMTEEKALERLNELAGEVLDPDVVQGFLAAHRNGFLKVLSPRKVAV